MRIIYYLFSFLFSAARFPFPLIFRFYLIAVGASFPSKGNSLGDSCVPVASSSLSAVL
jgi:hypothetical protein